MIGLEFLSQNIVKASALLALAFAATWMLRRGAASLRHFLWAAAFGALLLLPLFTAVMPKWGWFAVPEQHSVVTVRTVAVPVGPVPVTRPNPVLPYRLLLVWAAGFLIAAVRFSIGAARTARMVRRAKRFGPPAGLDFDLPGDVLESSEIPVPLAWGIRRPAIVLPVEARAWDAARISTVVLHERMHLERRDLWVQLLGQTVCCLYWFHPLAWLAARALRKERERACDDAVLLRGTAAHEYAAHLVGVVRGMARKSQWAGAVGMAERSDLESRIRALLDPRRPRHPLTRAAALSVSAAALAGLMVLAAVTTYAQARGTLAGVVKDPSGAVIPNCQVKARNLDGANVEGASCDMVGVYRFAAIPPGRYELTFQVPGFAALKAPATVTAGVAARLDANLELGSVNQVVTITGQRPGALAPQAPAGPRQRIRVGGNVQASRLLIKTDPVYPEDAKQQGVEGRVTIRAIISKTGDLLSSEVISTVDPRLAKAALDAVAQWRYTPTLLNGEPVETLVNIDLDFKLGQ